MRTVHPPRFSQRAVDGCVVRVERMRPLGLWGIDVLAGMVRRAHTHTRTHTRVLRFPRDGTVERTRAAALESRGVSPRGVQSPTNDRCHPTCPRPLWQKNRECYSRVLLRMYTLVYLKHFTRGPSQTRARLERSVSVCVCRLVPLRA